MKNLVWLVFGIVLFSGCVSAPVYRGPSSDQPSAVLRFQSLEGLAGVGGCQAVFLEAVNGKSVSEWYAHWSLTHTIRVNEGTNTIDVMGQSPDGHTKANAELVFEAKAGENYLVKREDEVKDLHFMIVDSKGNIVVEARGQKKPMTTDYPETTYVPYIPVAK